MIRRVPSKIVDGGDDAAAVLAKLSACREARLLAEKDEKTVESVAKTLLGDAEMLTAPGWIYEAKSIARKGYTAEASEYTKFTLKETK